MAIANNQTMPDPSQKSAIDTQILHDDIRAKWSKLSDFEVGALKDTDDLVTQVSTRYTLDREQAKGDVAALLNGRRL